MFRSFKKNLGYRLLYAITILIALSSCTEIKPPPPAPDIPIVQPNELLHIGIDPQLTMLRPILAEQTGNKAGGGSELIFVPNTNDKLQEQMLAQEIDGMFVYQKPTPSAFWTMPVALDSIAIIAHASLTVDSLSRSDLQQIFAGDLRNWQRFSGQDLPISVFVMGGESEIVDMVNKRVMENRPFDISAVVPLNLDAMLKAIADTEGSIGFVPTSVINPDAAANLQIVPVDRLFPQFNTVRSQQYPLTIPIYLASPNEPAGELRKLAAWLQSAEGQQSLSTQFVQIGN